MTKFMFLFVIYIYYAELAPQILNRYSGSRNH